MAVDVPGGILKQSDVRETITNTEETNVLFNTDFARFENTKALGANLKGIYINPEGKELYTCDDADDIKQWTLSTRWDVSTATLTHTLDVSAKETELVGIFFKTDGTKMYTTGDNGNSIDEYDLSTPWAISSAIYLQEFSTAGETTAPGGLYIREDGKRVYIIDKVAVEDILEYQLTTAWDITTATKIDSVITNLAGNGLYFKRDGSEVYIAFGGNEFKIWTLTTVFKISTASADSTFDAAPANPVVALTFNSNGSRMYLLSATNVYEYTIKRGWR